MGTVIWVESPVFSDSPFTFQTLETDLGDAVRDSAWQLGPWRTFGGDKIKDTIRENVVYCVKSANFVFKFTQM